MTEPERVTEPTPRPPVEKLRLDFLSSHTRYKNAAGQKIPGVTTVLGMLNKPALLRWAWGLGKAGIELEAARQQAADVGTVAHGLCEAHLRGMELDRENITPEALSKAETGFLRFLDFWDGHQLTVVETEHQMVSERMQVGGTADVIARRGDGALVLADMKTGKAIYDEQLIQVAVYAAMYEETTGQPIADVYVVRIGKEDADDLEFRLVSQRAERVEAFTALATARALLKKAGMKL